MIVQTGRLIDVIDFDAEKHEAFLRELVQTGQQHEVPLWALLGRGVPILVLPPNGLPFEAMGGLSWVTIFRDEIAEGVRYDGYHLDSLGRLLAATQVWAIMVPPVNADAYESLAVCAEHALNIVIVETTPEREQAWFAYLSAFAPDAGKLRVSPSIGGLWFDKPTPRLLQ
jgi:hypothetical protein